MRFDYHVRLAGFVLVVFAVFSRSAGLTIVGISVSILGLIMTIDRIDRTMRAMEEEDERRED